MSARSRGSGVFAPGRSERRAVLAGAVVLTVAGAGSAVALGPGADAPRAVVVVLVALVAAAYAAVGVLALVGRRRARTPIGHRVPSTGHSRRPSATPDLFSPRAGVDHDEPPQDDTRGRAA